MVPLTQKKKKVSLTLEGFFAEWNSTNPNNVINNIKSYGCDYDRTRDIRYCGKL